MVVDESVRITISYYSNQKKKPFPHLEDLFDQLNGVVFYMFISSLAIIKWPNQICVHELERIPSLLVMIIMNM
jgi:hypothetical protein